MATSSKVQFKLDTLKERALRSIDEQIEKKRTEVESFGDVEALARRIENWRILQEGKVSGLYRDLKSVDNDTLARFHLDPIPKVDTYSQSRAEKRLQILLHDRSVILAKADSLVPDADGNVSLTKTQLREFFNL